VTDSSPDQPNDEAAFLPPDWTELEPLLDQVLDVPVQERAARIVELSRGNLTRQRALEQLLADAERDTPLLDDSAARRFDELASDYRDTPLPELLAGRYRVGRELGRGGMATVYLGHDVKHGRDVAIKIIRSELSASLGHERFLREIEIAARLRHPNIVPLYDSGEVDGSLFFVMPYEEGQSLRERLKQDGALPITDALSVLRDVARALAYAHEHGVVHRDIKPDNVMLSGGAAVVTDFGIAKAVSVALTDSPDATLTQAGMVIGTPAYMAPEQATGDAAIDHRADIYSFGCLGYELLTGNPPFREQSSHLLIAAHIATVPRPVTELRAELPTSVADLVARCLAKDPAARPQSARELLPVLDGATGVSSSSPPQRPRSRGWGRPRIAAAVTVFAAMAAIGGYFATRTAGAAGPITLAVLPFSNIAGDSAVDFVVDGLADEVASALARVPGILIKSRSGARAYRGQLAPDVTEAGARLKADYLVTAVVRQERGRWIVSADLERAADATSLWDDAFLVNPNEQAAVADSIAGSLTAALRRAFPRAVGVAPSRASNQRTSNNEAYRLYLRGLEKLARRGLSVKEAAELFRQAIRQDSLFAPAYSGLSIALALSPWFHRVPSTVVHDDIGAAAHRALALDSTQSLPHVALGLAHWQAYDWEHAAIEFETAVRLDPNNVEARVQYSRMLRNTARYAEALVQLRAARSVDPASALVLSHMAGTYMLTGQVDSALTEIRRALETDSTNYTTVLYATRVYLKTNRLEEAHAIAVSHDDGYGLAKSGDVEGARQLLRRLDARPRAWGDETQRAQIHLGLGDTASALSALERATDARELWPVSGDLAEPMYDVVRGSARFRKLLQHVGLAEYLASNPR
jgi:TolB-like protein/Tfp pilus assembly protein PilF